MAALNRYYRHSKLTERRFRRVTRCFALDLTATDTAELTGLSRRSVNDLYARIRQRLYEDCERNALSSGYVAGEVELDESYFGRRRVRGKPGRGAGGKTIVFGIFERGGRVYTEILPDLTRKTLRAIIRGRVSMETVVHSDGWSGYDGLVHMGYAKHFRVTHRDGEFASGRSHINGIESFWSFAKRRMTKFNGLRKEHFLLHLKECEWRFNHRGEDLYRTLLRLLRNHPL
jgi:transposase-like protein